MIDARTVSGADAKCVPPPVYGRGVGARLRQWRSRILSTGMALTVACFTLSILPSICFAVDLPPVVDEYRLLADKWAVRDPLGADPRYCLEVKHEGGQYSWPIEPGWIAQSVKGNAVANQDVAAVALAHISETQRSHGYLMFKVASLQSGGPLFVRSLKLFDAREAYDRAAKLGSPILSLEAQDVRRMGFDRYTQKVTRTTDADWKQLDGRGVRKNTP